MKIKDVVKQAWEIWNKDPKIAAHVGGLLLVAAMWCEGLWASGIAVAAILLLGVYRVLRELLLAVVLLGATYHGFSGLLKTLLAPIDLSPAKAIVAVAAVLAWTMLIAICLWRILGKREED